MKAKPQNTIACVLIGLLFASLGCDEVPWTGKSPDTAAEQKSESAMTKDRSVADKVVKTDEQWRRILTPEQYHITREKGTEIAFTGNYWNFKGTGTYYCVGCGNELFGSETKFDFGCGWPSFYAPAEPNNVQETPDMSHSMIRTEITCSKCDAHLGHVFNDGPKPTGLTYCINSAALNFKAGKQQENRFTAPVSMLQSASK